MIKIIIKKKIKKFDSQIVLFLKKVLNKLQLQKLFRIKNLSFLELSKCWLDQS